MTQDTINNICVFISIFMICGCFVYSRYIAREEVKMNYETQIKSLEAISKGAKKMAESNNILNDIAVQQEFLIEALSKKLKDKAAQQEFLIEALSKKLKDIAVQQEFLIEALSKKLKDKK